MSSLPTGTVTFLFTDIEGSTALLQRLGDRRYAEALQEHRRLLRDAFGNGSGQEIETQGDAFLVAFPRARDALATATAAQQALMKHPWPDGASLRVRMGLHTGEPLSGEAGYVGMDVHRAARIVAAGHGGQIIVSDATHSLVAKDLPEGVSLRDLGEHRLKDLAHPHRLFQVLTVDLPADFPPIRSLDVLPNNLPRQLTSFVGREKEMAEVKRLLSTGNLVTLTGSGGAGKTRLALQVVADVVDHYRDGVWLAEFAPIADPALVPKTVALALDVPEQPGRDMTNTLIAALRPKSLLLVLDNCEHLVAASRALAAALLRACAQVRILATSREGLGVPGEVLWRVPSLSVPQDIHDLPAVAELRLYDAVRLFVDRAVATAPEFTVTRENAPAVVQVCQRLDGIPLAIELAAARVKVLAVEQIAVRLDDRFRLLTGGSPIALARQQTLRGAVDWSYQLLSETERVLLRRLSVFAGGWTLEAAEAVCAGGSVETVGILDLLTSLVDKSLVVAETQREEARYRLLETIRQYSGDRLVESGEADDVRKRHRDWYLELAEQAHREWWGPRSQRWSERLETEHDNLRAALEYGKAEKHGAEVTAQLAGALHFFWHAHGHSDEAREWLEGALEHSGEVSPLALLKVLQAATFFAYQRGDYQRALVLGENGVALSRDIGDKENRSLLLLWLGSVATRQRNYARATVLCEESLGLARDVGEHWLIGLALAQLGTVAREEGNCDRAAALHGESLAVARDAGDISQIAIDLMYLGTDRLRQHDFKEAADCYRESLRVSRELGNKWVAAGCIRGLGVVAGAVQDYVRAARLYGAADALLKQLGYVSVPGDQAYFHECVDTSHAALGDAAFEAAQNRGRAMTLEQAIEYALAVEAS